MGNNEKLKNIMLVPLAFMYALVKPIIALFKKLFGFIALYFIMLISPLLMRKREEKEKCDENDFVDYVENKNK